MFHDVQRHDYEWSEHTLTASAKMVQAGNDGQSFESVREQAAQKSRRQIRLTRLLYVAFSSPVEVQFQSVAAREEPDVLVFDWSHKVTTNGFYLTRDINISKIRH